MVSSDRCEASIYRAIQISHVIDDLIILIRNAAAPVALDIGLCLVPSRPLVRFTCHRERIGHPTGPHSDHDKICAQHIQNGNGGNLPRQRNTCLRSYLDISHPQQTVSFQARHI